MSTRSTIGYETADGDYVGVYCHYDGYPAHMGPALHAMLHADVVIMVSKGLAGGGIRSIFEPENEGRHGGYEVFNDGPRDPDTEWPRRPEEYAYRKRWDGQVEFIDSTGNVYEWLPEIGYQD
jgi:hypothetical protein